MNVITLKGLEFHQLQNLDSILCFVARAGDWVADIAFLSLHLKVLKAMLRIVERCERASIQLRYCHDLKLRDQLNKELIKSKKNKLSLTMAEVETLQGALRKMSGNDIVDAGLTQVYQGLACVLADSNHRKLIV